MPVNNGLVQRPPFRLYLDDFGPKGDGVQGLVTTVAGSAVINTTPLGAPAAAPVPTTAATGGTILAGTYLVIYTLVNRWGETVGSASGSITTTGSTSTITIPSPAAIRNATGWYAYVTQAGGGAGTETRQQAAGSPTPIREPLVLTAPPTNTGAAVPGADTTAARLFTSTAVDGGKNIMINGGLGTPGAPWVDTILSVQSPTQATLSTNGASQGGNVSQAGCAAVFASDDRLALDACNAQAATMAGFTPVIEVVASNKVYGLGTGFFQSTINTVGSNPTGVQYNTQFRIPAGVVSTEGPKIEYRLVGAGENSHGQFWASPLPDLGGTCFVSFSMGPTTADPVYEQQSVIAGPKVGTQNGNNAFANVKVVIDGIQVVMPGWSNSIGIDLQRTAACHVRGAAFAYAPSTNIGGGVNPSNGWQSNSFWINKLGTGIATPFPGNNDEVILSSWTTEGLKWGVTGGSDHFIALRLCTICVDQGMLFTTFDGNTHDLTIVQWSIEASNSGLVTQGGSGHIKCHIVMDGENNNLTDVSDTGNALYGDLYWSDPFRATLFPTINGAQKLNIHNRMLGPAIAPGVVALTDAATIAVEADLGNDFRVTLGGNRTMGVPTHPQDGQMIVFELTQDATGSRLVTWTSTAGGYAFGAAGAPTLSTAAGAVDQVGFKYNAAKNLWLYTGSVLGF